MRINKILLITFLGVTQLAAVHGQNIFPDSGRVGIGTTTPSATLEVNGEAKTAMLLFRGTGANSNVTHNFYGIYQEPGPWTGTYPELVINYHTGIKMSAYSAHGGIKFYTGYISTNAAPNNLAFSIGDGDNNVRVSNSLFVSANVGIGTTTPGAYKLAVEGMIGARKVKVTQGSWADFVFKPDYELPSLTEVDLYVRTHGHLQDIPSEQEIVSDGLDLGDMNKKLLQKIEELTLYLIDQDKKVKNQQGLIEMLQKELLDIKSKLNTRS